MAVDRVEMLFRSFGDLQFQRTEKHLRISLGGTTIADTRRAALVWEPRRVVAQYAVPIGDITADLVPDDGAAAEAHPVSIGDGPPVLDPSTAFSVHSCPGTPQQVVAGEARGGAFRPDDPDLNDMVVLDFAAFTWLEEDEELYGHPRDPFSRIDVRSSSRHIRIESGGAVLAESTQPLMLFESVLPARYYLPPEDVLVELKPSSTRTVCAYKGFASHWSVDGIGSSGTDVAWSYPDPPPELGRLAGYVCFYQERLDTTVDGVLLDKPKTPWS